MLETAPARPRQELEDVFLVWQEAPESVVLLDERLQIASGAIAVPSRAVARADDKVLLARHGKFTNAQLPRHDRRVDERLVIGGTEVAHAAAGRIFEAGHGRGPARSELDANVVR